MVSAGELTSWYFEVAWPAINEAKQKSQKASAAGRKSLEAPREDLVIHPADAPFGYRAAQGVHVAEARRFLGICDHHASKEGPRGWIALEALEALLRAALRPLEAPEMNVFLRVVPGLEDLVDAAAPPPAAEASMASGDCQWPAAASAGAPAAVALAACSTAPRGPVPRLLVDGGWITFGALVKWWFGAVWPRASTQLLTAHHAPSQTRQNVSVTVELG